jgi:pimeloyl-ACP methyl ester carboxylesterase
VVLVHGFAVWSYIWEPTMQALARAGYQAVSFDLYGRGYSDKPQLVYDRDLFDNELHELIKRLEFKNRPVLAGLSMGGGIAAGFSAKHREMISGLVLIAPAGAGERPGLEQRLIQLPLVGELLSFSIGDQYLVKGLEQDMHQPVRFDFYKSRFKEQLGFKGYKRSLLSSLRNGLLNGRLAEYQKAGALHLPQLIIWGNRDKVVPREQIKAIKKAMPGAEYREIESCGHIPHFEKPEITNSILLDFLGRI